MGSVARKGSVFPEPDRAAFYPEESREGFGGVLAMNAEKLFDAAIPEIPNAAKDFSIIVHVWLPSEPASDRPVAQPAQTLR